jgi:signal transduction histidine kinase/DNA-binding NarL/FixJ family response regulator
MTQAAATILVVDDDDHVRDALVDELGSAYQVETASCGSDAFDALVSRQYDVVISDLRMPDHDGIEVLDFARRHQRDAVRILLTGYLDERAHRALLADDAPFKVGKPWHDEIEVAVRRGLEVRDMSRRMSASLADALDLTRIDDELAAAATPVELAETVVRRALAIDGVASCRVRDHGGRSLAGPKVLQPAGWSFESALDGDGDLVFEATGTGDGSHQLVGYLAYRAQRRAGVFEARVAPIHDGQVPRHRVDQLMRQATIGALTSSLLHDLASVIQAMSGALDEIAMLAQDSDIPGLSDAITEASDAGGEISSLFVAMRKFIRGGDVVPRPITADDLVKRAVKVAGSYVRERASLAIAEIPDIRVSASEPLMLQVLVNILRNAANASPTGGTVDVVVTATETDVTFTITDDGPGVSPEIQDTMFEAFASSTQGGTGLGLAISAHVVRLHQGTIRYHRAKDRGACFSVTLARAGV